MYRILVVDDSEQQRFLLREIMRTEGHQVTLAAQGAEALELARREPPDAVIADVLMPVMDGFRLCHEWKRDPALKQIPFVFCTGAYTDALDEEAALKAGADGFIRKPIDPSTFLKGVRAIIGRSRQTQTVRVPSITSDAAAFKLYHERSMARLESEMRELEREINERHRAEEALRESEEKFRAVFSQTYQAMWLLDLSGVIVAANDTSLQLTGADESETTGCRIWDGPWWCGDPGQPDRLRDAVRRAAAGETVRLDLLLEAGGESRSVDFSAKPIRDGAGQVVHISAEGRDITEMRRAEQTLRMTQRSVDCCSTAIFWIRPGGTVFYANDAACRQLGYRREQLLGLSVSDFNPSWPAEYWRSDAWRWMKEGGALVFESIHRTADGRSIPVALTTNYVAFEGDEYVFAFATDLSNWKGVETALRDSEGRYRALFEASTDGIMLLKDGQVVDCNPRALEMFDCRRDDVIGRPLWRFCDSSEHPDETPEPQPAESVRERLLAARNGVPQAFEVRLLRPRPGPFAEVNLQPVQLNSGAHVLAIIRDVTARKAAEAERRRLEGQLRHVHKMEAIGTLAGGIAHDFNNMLGAIGGYTDLALNTPFPEGSRAPAYLAQVVKAVDRARDLASRILTFSRRTEQERQPIDLRPLVEEGLKLIRASIPTSVAIRSRVSAQPVVVDGDATQLHQVLMNLCTNAAHAVDDAGEVRVELDVEVLHAEDPALNSFDIVPGPYARLRVSDSGPGIPESLRERIFEPFFTTKPRGEGTGLGLSVVHGIVRTCSGAIRVGGGTEGGAVVDVLLPLKRPHLQPDEAAPAEADPRGRGERILLVDDEEMLADLESSRLEQLGYAVTAYTDPAAALKAFRADPEAFDLLITDQTMPRLTGLELAVEIHRIRPQLPVILCSGYSRRLVPAEVEAAGIFCFLQKPLKRAALLNQLRVALEPPGDGEPSETP